MPVLLHQRRRRFGGVAADIPAGLILPWTGTAASLPDAWSRWQPGAAVGRCLRGALTYGATHTPGTISFPTSTTGGHNWASGSALVQPVYRNGGGPWDFYNGTTNRGDHTHSNITVSNFSPMRRLQIMIQAQERQTHFPLNIGLLADQAIPGANDVTPYQGSFLSVSSGENSNSAQSFTPSIPSGGGHTHVTNTTGSEHGGGCNSMHTVGNSVHGHSAGSIALTLNTQRIWFGMWQVVSEVLPQEGIFALWEDSTPPDKWAICDGNNGTPNLLNYCIGLDSSKAGVQDGNDTIARSGSLASATWTHGHAGGSCGFMGNNTPHTSSALSHTHSVSGSSAYIPSNITVVILKYIG